MTSTIDPRALAIAIELANQLSSDGAFVDEHDANLDGEHMLTPSKVVTSESLLIEDGLASQGLAPDIVSVMDVTVETAAANARDTAAGDAKMSGSTGTVASKLMSPYSMFTKLHSKIRTVLLDKPILMVSIATTARYFFIEARIPIVAVVLVLVIFLGIMTHMHLPQHEWEQEEGRATAAGRVWAKPAVVPSRELGVEPHRPLQDVERMPGRPTRRNARLPRKRESSARKETTSGPAVQDAHQVSTGGGQETVQDKAGAPMSADSKLGLDDEIKTAPDMSVKASAGGIKEVAFSKTLERPADDTEVVEVDSDSDDDADEEHLVKVQPAVKKGAHLVTVPDDQMLEDMDVSSPNPSEAVSARTSVRARSISVYLSEVQEKAYVTNQVHRWERNFSERSVPLNIKIEWPQAHLGSTPYMAAILTTSEYLRKRTSIAVEADASITKMELTPYKAHPDLVRRVVEDMLVLLSLEMTELKYLVIKTAGVQAQLANSERPRPETTAPVSEPEMLDNEVELLGRDYARMLKVSGLQKPRSPRGPAVSEPGPKRIQRVPALAPPSSIPTPESPQSVPSAAFRSMENARVGSVSSGPESWAKSESRASLSLFGTSDGSDESLASATSGSWTSRDSCSGSFDLGWGRDAGSPMPAVPMTIPAQKLGGVALYRVQTEARQAEEAQRVTAMMESLQCELEAMRAWRAQEREAAKNAQKFLTGQMTPPGPLRTSTNSWPPSSARPSAPLPRVKTESAPARRGHVDARPERKAQAEGVPQRKAQAGSARRAKSASGKLTERGGGTPRSAERNRGNTPEHRGDPDSSDSGSSSDRSSSDSTTTEPITSSRRPSTKLTSDDSWRRTDMGWNAVGWGFQKLLVWIQKRYAVPNGILVTENGCAWPDRTKEEAQNDDFRVGFYQEYLTGLYNAIAEGADVRGYFAWSFVDNYEWAEGYTKRFGLHWVDYETMERSPKKSALWYGDVIRNNGFTASS
ncbi:hypothetical protein ON010_g6033 [Phytophthora cinnamomi]|nr:hypothetical protein ON010_g6033 [Phytophthora cinnamomi]